MSEQATIDLHAGLLRAWHLAILRFALTRENADRLGVLAIANEIDRLGRPHDVGSDFRFFRRTSAELCAAILLLQENDDATLNRYLAQIDDARLHTVMAAALELVPRQTSSARKRIGPNHDLWKGLTSRANSQP
jgi:hypothetical protein